MKFQIKNLIVVISFILINVQIIGGINVSPSKTQYPFYRGAPYFHEMTTKIENILSQEITKAGYDTWIQDVKKLIGELKTPRYPLPQYLQRQIQSLENIVFIHDKSTKPVSDKIEETKKDAEEIKTEIKKEEEKIITEEKKEVTIPEKVTVIPTPSPLPTFGPKKGKTGVTITPEKPPVIDESQLATLEEEGIITAEEKRDLVQELKEEQDELTALQKELDKEIPHSDQPLTDLAEAQKIFDVLAQYLKDEAQSRKFVLFKKVGENWPYAVILTKMNELQARIPADKKEIQDLFQNTVISEFTKFLTGSYIEKFKDISGIIVKPKTVQGWTNDANIIQKHIIGTGGVFGTRSKLKDLEDINERLMASIQLMCANRNEELLYDNNLFHKWLLVEQKEKLTVKAELVIQNNLYSLVDAYIMFINTALEKADKSSEEQKDKFKHFYDSVFNLSYIFYHLMYVFGPLVPHEIETQTIEKHMRKLKTDLEREFNLNLEIKK